MAASWNGGSPFRGVRGGFKEGSIRFHEFPEWADETQDSQTPRGMFAPAHGRARSRSSEYLDLSQTDVREPRELDQQITKDLAGQDLAFELHVTGIRTEDEPKPVGTSPASAPY